MAVKNLRISGTVTLNAAGAGTVSLSPSSQRASAYWHVTGLVAQTNRPGVAPIPRLQIFQDNATADNSLGLTYDGSFCTATADERLSRGQTLLCVWTGGLAGDVATVVLTGTME